MLDATLLRGENKDEPTRSILNVVPTKNDDGASYRCTVWNRALRQEHSLEAGTKIYVNCKYTCFSLYIHIYLCSKEIFRSTDLGFGYLPCFFVGGWVYSFMNFNTWLGT